MVSTFSPNLNLDLQGTGDNVNTWGQVLNNDVFSIIDAAMGNTLSLPLAAADVTLTTAQTQNNFIDLSGALLTNINITFPQIGRTYFVRNRTTGNFTVTLKTSAVSGVTYVIPQGLSTTVVLNGTDVLALPPQTSIAPVSAGFRYGLSLSNNATDPTNDIDIATGSAASDDVTVTIMNLSAVLTKRLDALWTVGTNQGGLDTGAIADGTYHVWLIQRSDTGVVDALFSTSASSPTMPANYNRKRRIGSIIRAAAAIIKFVQNGKIFSTDAQADVSATNPGTAAVTRTLTTPAGIKTVAFGTVGLFGANNGFGYTAFLSSLDLTDQPSGSSNAQISFTSGSANNRQTSHFQVPTNTSSQIRSRIGISEASTVLTIVTRGWIDTSL